MKSVLNCVEWAEDCSLFFIDLPWLLKNFSNFLETWGMLCRPIFAFINSSPLPTAFWRCWWIFLFILLDSLHITWRTAAFSCSETSDSRRWCCGPCRVLSQVMWIALGSDHGTWKRHWVLPRFSLAGLCLVPFLFPGNWTVIGKRLCLTGF